LASKSYYDYRTACLGSVTHPQICDIYREFGNICVNEVRVSYSQHYGNLINGEELNNIPVELQPAHYNH